MSKVKRPSQRRPPNKAHRYVTIRMDLWPEMSSRLNATACRALCRPVSSLGVGPCHLGWSSFMEVDFLASGVCRQALCSDIPLPRGISRRAPLLLSYKAELVITDHVRLRSIRRRCRFQSSQLPLSFVQIYRKGPSWVAKKIWSWLLKVSFLRSILDIFVPKSVK